MLWTVESLVLLSSLLFAWLFRMNLDSLVKFPNFADLWAVPATFVLILMVECVDRLLPKTMRAIDRFLDEVLRPTLEKLASWKIPLLAGLAGLAEELFFRGFLHGLWTPAAGLFLGILLTSLAFGAAHWVSWPYFVLATAVGLYFSVLLLLTGSLWTPILTHALYDWWAFRRLLSTHPPRALLAEDSDVNPVS